MIVVDMRENCLASPDLFCVSFKGNNQFCCTNVTAHPLSDNGRLNLMRQIIFNNYCFKRTVFVLNALY